MLAKVAWFAVMKKHVLDGLVRRARRWLPNHPQYDCYAHFCFVFQSGRLVAAGTNTVHEPPRHHGYHRQVPAGRPKTHAEWTAYRRARRNSLSGEFVVVNIRLNKGGRTKPAKPCQCCYDLLRSFGCREFVCSLEDNEWTKVV